MNRLTGIQNSYRKLFLSEIHQMTQLSPHTEALNILWGILYMEINVLTPPESSWGEIPPSTGLSIALEPMTSDLSTSL